jgi:hypothetical protein
MQEVVYKISPDGTRVKVEAEGFTGGECKDFTKGVINKLGFVVDSKDKPEMWMTCGNCNSAKA